MLLYNHNLSLSILFSTNCCIYTYFQTARWFLKMYYSVIMWDCTLLFLGISFFPIHLICKLNCDKQKVFYLLFVVVVFFYNLLYYFGASCFQCLDANVNGWDSILILLTFCGYHSVNQSLKNYCYYCMELSLFLEWKICFLNKKDVPFERTEIMFHFLFLLISITFKWPVSFRFYILRSYI